MKNSIKVSIITVCLNAVTTIGKTIKSVASQSYNNIEHIVVDGGSSDGTLKILKKYNKYITQWISEPDNGIYDAMNKGLDLAGGEIVMFLNANDIFNNRKIIGKIIKEFENDKADIIYGNVRMISHENNIDYIQKYNNVDKIYLTTKNICHQAMFSRKKLYNRYGSFNTSYKIAGDYDWYLRMILENNVTSHYVDIIVSVFSLDGVSGDLKYRKATLTEFNRVARQYFAYRDRLIGKIRYLPEYIKWLVYQNIVKSARRIINK